MFLSNLTINNYQFISAGHWVVIDEKDFALISKGLILLITSNVSVKPKQPNFLIKSVTSSSPQVIG
jgi:hypothetical protein